MTDINYCQLCKSPMNKRRGTAHCSVHCRKKAYYERNKELKKKQAMDYYYSNREACLSSNALYRERNKEQIQEQRKKHREANREAINAKKVEATSYWVQEALWAENTQDPDVCLSVASEIPASACFLNEELDDFVARWLDPEY